LLAVSLATITALSSGARAQTEVAPPVDDDHVTPTRPGPRIKAGAWELGFGGSISNTNGVTYGSADVRGGTFAKAGRGLVGFETLLSYEKAGSDDFGDVQEWVTYQRPLDANLLGAGPGGLWPYVGVGGGVGRAWEHDATDTRYPLGFVVGARLLQGRGSAARVEYRFRHYFGAEDGGFDRSGWFVGYSFFVNNAAER
jgi:hypothetical protein